MSGRAELSCLAVVGDTCCCEGALEASAKVSTNTARIELSAFIKHHFNAWRMGRDSDETGTSAERLRSPERPRKCVPRCLAGASKFLARDRPPYCARLEPQSQLFQGTFGCAHRAAFWPSPPLTGCAWAKLGQDRDDEKEAEDWNFHQAGGWLRKGLACAH